MKIAIVGAGYWGIACALEARSRGIEVCLIDSSERMSGSKAAGGHFSLKWFKGDFKAHMKQAYEDAQRHGVLFDTSVAVINTIYDRKKHGKSFLKPKTDWWTFFPPQFLGLYPADISECVSSFKATHSGVELFMKDGSTQKADKLIICAGAWTDYLLHKSGYDTIGVSGLAGSGVTFKGKNLDNLILHQTTPFRQISVRNWGSGIIRVGETSEVKMLNHADYVEKMLNTVSHHTTNHTIDTVMTGYRAMRKQPFAGKVAPNTWAGAGGGRNGGVMSFWAARKILEEICG